MADNPSLQWSGVLEHPGHSVSRGRELGERGHVRQEKGVEKKGGINERVHEFKTLSTVYRMGHAENYPVVPTTRKHHTLCRKLCHLK